MKRQGTVKNLIGYEILPYLEDKKLTCYSFVDTGKRLLGLRQVALLLLEKVMPPKSHGVMQRLCHGCWDTQGATLQERDIGLGGFIAFITSGNKPSLSRGRCHLIPQGCLQ